MSLRVGNYKATSTKIPVMHLNNIVNVDLEAMTVKCEPMVTMGQVTHTLNKLGLTLPVVPELDDLTVGGLTCGVGIETSSHREGLFYHTCVSYEIVTADGKHLRCSKDENVDYFKAIPWSHGTLGILVGVEIQIVTCKPWVKLEYEPYHDKEAAIQACAEAFDSDIDFVEALVYGKGEWVLMKGTMVDVPVPEMVNAIGAGGFDHCCLCISALFGRFGPRPRAAPPTRVRAMLAVLTSSLMCRALCSALAIRMRAYRC